MFFTLLGFTLLTVARVLWEETLISVYCQATSCNKERTSGASGWSLEQSEQLFD